MAFQGYGSEMDGGDQHFRGNFEPQNLDSRLL